ncbi:alpha/beta hydrolase [Porticoccaceae bacterium]|nr:alpha/beta hydrolase [Porticoccaceae bacterium]
MLKNLSSSLLFFFVLLCSSVVSSGDNLREIKSTVDENGVFNLPASALAMSGYLNKESKEAYLKSKQMMENLKAMWLTCGPDLRSASAEEAPLIRECQAKKFSSTSFYRELMAKYDVDMKPMTIGGVYSEVFTPAAGISPENKNRVLINIHGSGQIYAARQASHLESVPIAEIARIKVVAPDYSMWPEHVNPAGVKDTLAVYRTLLKDYRPENIGIYGCSAGGQQAAQLMPWLQKEGLPMPGAIGIFGGAAGWKSGDTWALTGSFTARPYNRTSSDEWLKNPYRNGYFRGADFRDPLVDATASNEMLKKFPPSLLITSTRDWNLSQVVYTHTQLVKQDVEADLHIWEGFEHCFFVSPIIPESVEVHNVVAKFFDKHLGKSRR